MTDAAGSPEVAAEDTAAAELPLSDKKWFIIHTYSGFEQKVAEFAAEPRARRSDSPIRSARF